MAKQLKACVAGLKIKDREFREFREFSAYAIKSFLVRFPKLLKLPKLTTIAPKQTIFALCSLNFALLTLNLYHDGRL